MRVLLLLLLNISFANGLLRRRRNMTEAIEEMRIGKDSFDAAKNMHYMWYTHSVKALLVQVAKGIVPHLDPVAERSFLLCLNRIQLKTDLTRTAQCLVEARGTLDRRKERIDSTEAPAFIVRNDDANARTSGEGVPSFIVQKSADNIRLKVRNRTSSEAPSTRRFGIVNFRMTRRRSPSALERRQLLERHIRFFTRHRKKSRAHRRVKRSEYRLVPKGYKSAASRKIRKLARAPSLLDPRGSPVQQFTKTVTKLFRGDAKKAPRWADTYRSILKIKRDMEAREREPAARMYDSPVGELIFNKTLHRSPLRLDFPLHAKGMPPLMKDAVALADSVRTHALKTGGDPNFKMLSPRFAPVLPDKYESRGMLSPSFLAFYKDEAEDQIVPLPSLLEATGMQRKDRDSMLEMIMEISGARETVQEAAKVLEQMNLFGMEGEFVEVTKRVQAAFTDMAKSFTRRQKDEIKKRKYTFLEKSQLQALYAKQGLDRQHHEDFDLDEYSLLTQEQREAGMWRRIELIAANETAPVRSKRQIPGVLSVLQPNALSPYMFAPITGLSILGPTVLSPSLFSPLILNPAVLGPYVLSPAIGMPFILSPYLLSPYVLSPMIMDPFILSPYVLSPNVFNPYLLSPLILSPLVLCPDVFSPMVIGGSILSPGLASPSVFSKGYIMASVLSPTAIS